MGVGVGGGGGQFFAWPADFSSFCDFFIFIFYPKYGGLVPRVPLLNPSLVWKNIHFSYKWNMRLCDWGISLQPDNCKKAWEANKTEKSVQAATDNPPITDQIYFYSLYIIITTCTVKSVCNFVSNDHCQWSIVEISTRTASHTEFYWDKFFTEWQAVMGNVELWMWRLNSLLWTRFCWLNKRDAWAANNSALSSG